MKKNYLLAMVAGTNCRPSQAQSAFRRKLKTIYAGMYLLWEQSFYGQKWTSDGDRLREHYYLTKKKIYLEETERKLSATKIRLDKESARLENLCQTETAKEKIAFIAACFLFKNLKIAQEYEDAKKLVKDLFDKL